MPPEKIRHNRAALDPSEIERILDTVCRHRGTSSALAKVVVAKQLSLSSGPDATI